MYVCVYVCMYSRKASLAWPGLASVTLDPTARNAYLPSSNVRIAMMLRLIVAGV